MKQNKNKVKWIALLLALLTVISIAMMSFMFAAYLRKTTEAGNNFKPDLPVTPTVKEKFDGQEKKNVKIEVGDTGYPVYVRAAIVVTWKRAKDDPVVKDAKKDDVYFIMPKEGRLAVEGDDIYVDGEENYYGDYMIYLSLGDDSNWVKIGDYYYYKLPVESGKETEALIERCFQVNPQNAPEGYVLSVDIIAQTVQAIGTTDEDNENVGGDKPAYKDAWDLKEQDPIYDFEEPKAPSTGADTDAPVDTDASDSSDTSTDTD